MDGMTIYTLVIDMKSICSVICSVTTSEFESLITFTFTHSTDKLQSVNEDLTDKLGAQLDSCHCKSDKTFKFYGCREL